jgi:hypothetical protein
MRKRPASWIAACANTCGAIIINTGAAAAARIFNLVIVEFL